MTTRNFEGLSTALQSFAASPRFNFMKTLQVGRFVSGPPGSLGVVSEFTFEKLVELGTKKLAKLRWLTPVQEEQLITLLGALTDGELPLLQAPPRPEKNVSENASAASFGRREEDDDGEVVGSAHVELKLRESLKRLKASPGFEKVRALPLGHFWDQKWPHAPFEEALTLEQLGEIDLTTLMKKRTMSNRRIAHIAEAVDRALTSADETPSQPLHVVAPADESQNDRSTSDRNQAASDSPPLRLVKSEHVAPFAMPDQHHPWMKHLESAPALARAAAEHFLTACKGERAGSTKLDALIRTIPDRINLSDFVTLATGGVVSDGLRRRVQEWITSAEFIEGAAILRAALEGPGVRLETLVLGCTTYSFSKANAELGVLLLTRLLGAVEVKVDREVCRGVWTINPQLVEMIVKAIKRRKSGVAAALSSACPYMESELRDWLVEILSSRS